MNTFRMRSDGQVVSEAQYRAMFPNTSFPALLIPDDADVVFASPQPTVTSSQYVISIDPVQDANENWVQGWQVMDYSDEIIAINLAARKASLTKQVDSMVDKIMADAIGGRLSQYQRAETHARAYKAASYTGTVPPAVKSWSETKSKSATWAADSIIAQADALIAAEETIYDKRLKVKEAIRSAAVDADLGIASANFNGFVAAIRGQLGV